MGILIEAEARMPGLIEDLYWEMQDRGLLPEPAVAVCPAGPEPKEGPWTIRIDAWNHDKTGLKINCIKEIRACTGAGLKEAKEFSERTIYPIYLGTLEDEDAANLAAEKFAQLGVDLELIQLTQDIKPF